MKHWDPSHACYFQRLSTTSTPCAFRILIGKNKPIDHSRPSEQIARKVSWLGPKEIGTLEGKDSFCKCRSFQPTPPLTTLPWHAHFRDCGYTIGSVSSGPNSISASFPHFFQVLSQITLSQKHLSDNPIKIKSPPLTLNDSISNNAADICFFPCYAIHQMWAKHLFYSQLCTSMLGT